MNLNQLNNDAVKAIQDCREKYLGNIEDIFLQMTEGFTEETFDEMTDGEIIGFNNYEKGRCLLAEPDFDNKHELAEYLRAFFKFFVNTNNFDKKLDEHLEELNNIVEESQEEIDKMFDEENPVYTVRNRINEAIEQLESEPELNMEKYIKVIQAKDTFEESFNLRRIKELYRTINPDNLKEDAKSMRSMDMYKDYLKAQSKLGIKYDIVQIHDLELRFLPEDYHELNNLFIFACMKYIRKAAKTGDKDDAFFISQLTSNLYMLHTNKLPGEYKDILLENIEKFLDIVR